MLPVHYFTTFFLSGLNFYLLKSLLLIIEIPTNRLFQITYEFQKLCNFVKIMKLSSPNDYDKTNAESKGEDNKYKQQPLATISICRSFPATTSLDRIDHVSITLTLCCISLRRCCFGLETRVIIKILTHPC